MENRTNFHKILFLAILTIYCFPKLHGQCPEPFPDCYINCGVGLVDKDGDGVPDAYDLDDDNDGISDCVENNVVGCVQTILGPELVINGDFSEGYRYWTSDFNRGRNNNTNMPATNGGCANQGWVAISPCNTANGACDPYYSYFGGTYDGSIIITDAGQTGANIWNAVCNETASSCDIGPFPDHTANGDNLSLYIDPSDIIGESYYKIEVPVESCKTYRFSAWINVVEEDPNVVFKIGGVDVAGPINLDGLIGGDSGPDIWQEVATEWTATADGVTFIELVNTTAGCNGNDIKLDDVSFREVQCDSDLDGIVNSLDLDSDNDGIPDAVEACGNISLTLEDCSLDSNGDEVYEIDPMTGCSTGVVDGSGCDPLSDIDMDGVPDFLDLDSDADGCPDAIEAGTNNLGNVSIDTLYPGSVDDCGLLLGPISGICPIPTTTDWIESSVAECGEIDVVKMLNSVTPVAGMNNVFDLEFEVLLTNTGSLNLVNLSLWDDFTNQLMMASPSDLSLQGSIVIGGDATVFPIVNPLYNGGDGTASQVPANANDIFFPQDISSVLADCGMDPVVVPSPALSLLEPGQEITATFTLRIDNALDVGVDLTMMENQATGSGLPASIEEPSCPATNGSAITDNSDNNSSTNPDDPDSDDDNPTPIVLPGEIDLTKELTTIIPAMTPGNALATYEFEVCNIGGSNLMNISLIDNFSNEFGSGFVGVTVAPMITGGTTTATVNSTYTGFSPNIDMLNGDGALLVGDCFTLSVQVELDMDMLPDPAENQASASGTDSSGNVVEDLSDDVSDIDGDMMNDNETGGTDDPTGLPPFPSVNIAKSVNEVISSPTSPDHYFVTYRHVIENTGNTILENFILTDDMITALQGGYVQTTNIEVLPGSPSAISLPMANASTTVMDGMNNALDGVSGIANPGESFIVDITVEIDASMVTGTQPLLNQSTAEGTPTDGMGNTLVDPTTGMPYMPGDVTDISDSGTAPESTNPGAPNDSGGSDDSTPLSLPGLIGVVKTISGTSPAASGIVGNYDITIDFVIENTGSVSLTNIQLVDMLSAQWGVAYVGVTTAPMITVVGGDAMTTDPTVNGSYDGDGVSELLNGDGELAVDESMTVQVVVEVDISEAPSTGLENQATASGVDPFGNEITDLSDDNTSGTDPADPNDDNAGGAGDDGTGDTNNPSPLLIPEISTVKAITGSEPASSGITGNFDVTYELVVENTGTTILENIALIDDIATQLSPAYVMMVQEALIISSSATMDPTPGAMPNLLDGTSGVMLPGESVTVEIVVEINASEVPPTGLTNQSTASGLPTDGMGNGIPDPNNPGADLGEVMDMSDSGTDPTSDNPDAPGDMGTTDDPTPLPPFPSIGVAKAVTNTAPASSGVAGNFDVEYTFVIENNGSADLDNISLTDDLGSQLGGAFIGVVIPPAIDGASTAVLTGGAEVTYTGSGFDIELLDMMGFLEPGETIVVTVTVELDPDAPGAITNTDGELENQGTASGDPLDEDGNPLTDPSGNPVDPVADDSDNGTDGTSDNGEGGVDDPTPLLLPSIGVAKAITNVAEASSGVEGNYDVTIKYTVINDGNADLTNLSLMDDIASQWGAAFVAPVVTSPMLTMSDATGGPTVNGGYAGVMDLLIPAGTDLLEPGQSFMVEVVVEVDASATGGMELLNQATAMAGSLDVDGNPGPDVMDDSDNGIDPSGDNGEGGNDDPTPLELPSIGVAKAAGMAVPVAGMPGFYDIEFTFIVENTGNVTLTNISLVDDFDSQFGPAFVAVTDGPNITGGTAAIPGGTNPNYSGHGVPFDEMLNGSGVLDPQENIIVTTTVRVDGSMIGEANTLLNQATANGTDPNGIDVMDESNNGSDPEGGDVPTPVVLSCFVEIVCPAVSDSIVVQNDLGWCAAIVNFEDVTINTSCAGIGQDDVQFMLSFDAIDPADGSTVAAGTWINGQPSGLMYAVGVTTVSFRVDPLNLPPDAIIDPATCEFDITVVDKEAPSIECPDDIEIEGSFGACSATLLVETPLGSDNCEIDTFYYTVVNPDGSITDAEIDMPYTFMAGKSEVLLYAEDEAGNLDSCSYDVTILCPSFGIAKREVSVVPMPNGCTSITYEFNVENFGGVVLDSLQVTDDLDAAGYAACGSYSIVSLTSDDYTINTLYDGSGVTEMLVGTDILDVGDKGSILMTVEACGCSAGTTIANSATATITTPNGNELTDESVNGSDPDANNDGDPINDTGTTNTTLGQAPILGLAKRLVQLTNNSDGTATVTYEINVENFGTLNIDSLQVSDDLVGAFDPCSSFNVLSITSDDFTVNGSYNGVTDTLLLLGDDLLTAGEKGAILFTVNIGGCMGMNGPYFNQAFGKGVGPAGEQLIDASQEGSDPDPDGDGNPVNNFEGTETMFEFNSFIGLSKNLLSLTQNTDGTVTLEFEFVVENFGDQILSNVQVTDDLANTFDPCTGIDVVSLSSSFFDVNDDNFNGDSDINLLLGMDLVYPGDIYSIDLIVIISDCGTATGPFFNSANVTSVNELNQVISDISQDGADADPDGDGDPTNNNVPTPIDFSFTPELGVAKRLSYGPILSTEGCYDIGFEIKVQNYGDVDLYDIQVLEDLTSVFSATDIFSVVSVESEEFDVNPAFDGVIDVNLLLGLDTLISQVGGNEGAINLLLNVCPDGSTDPYLNSVVATGIAPGGTEVQDTSMNGSSPDPDGDGDPTNNTEATPFQLMCAQPYFTNCPDLPINVDAPEGWCSAFVNFSTLQAEAECGLDSIAQVDDSGLNSGDLFPVGLTTLKWVAYDIQGNASDTCSLKIYVNDFHTPPAVECPADITLENDPFTCGATLQDVSLEMVTDNCADNLAITYEITDENGEIVSTGFDDATGAFTGNGTNTVTYYVHDQPLLLITEVNQAGPDQIEIANLGPASIDIGCLEIIRLGIGADTIMVSGPQTLVSGATATFDFASDLVDMDPAGYIISSNGVVLDEVSMNGMIVPSFTGSVIGRTITRTSIIDHDDDTDWVEEYCEPFIGTLTLPSFPSNGTTTTLQGAEGSVTECSFNVTVMDVETPTCAEYEILDFAGSASTINELTCASSLTSTISSGGLIGAIQIVDLDIDHPNVVDLSVNLISPQGTVVNLFDGLCAGTVDVFTSLSDTSATSINVANCLPLGSGLWHMPNESLSAFENENPNGVWEVQVINTGLEVGIINGFTLQLLELVPYSQMDVVLTNEDAECAGEFTWTHPVFQDNCEEGIVTVEYTSDDAASVPSGGIIVDGMEDTQIFASGTTNVLYTLVDAAGNMNTCGFSITVEDTEAPEILACPADMTMSLASGQCCEIINFQDPLVADNCGIDSIAYSTGNGVEYCIGTTIVELQVYDASGNSATCTFEVEVLEFEPDGGFNFTCNDDINLSLDANCEAIITADMILEGGNYGCYDQYCVTITDEAGNVLPDSIITIEYVNQQLSVEISDCVEGGNSCWGYVTIEHKTTPEISCPADITLQCNADLTDMSMMGEAMLLTCESEYEITFNDVAEDLGECADPRYLITRTWKVVNGNGDEATCIQQISLEGFDLAQVEWPEDYINDDRLSCSAVDADPELTEPSNLGYPTIEGMEIFGDHYCDLFVGYWDEILYDATCPSAYNILRHWIVRNACLPLIDGVNPIRHTQDIIVEDLLAPSLEAFDDVTISPDPWDCSASYLLPLPELTDNCSSSDDLEVQYSSVGGVIINGVLHINSPAVTDEEEAVVTIWATDGCSNYASTSFTVTVVDNVPPVIVAETSRTVSLSSDGVAKIFAEDFDDGSFDGCSPIEYFVRRMDAGGSCNPVNEFGLYPGSENGHDVAANNVDDNAEFNDIVHFCCADVGNTVMVQFKVCDDANGDGIIGNVDDNCSVAMVEVEVQDKLAPVIQCPADMTISCIDLAGLGNLQDLSDDFLNAQFGEATAAATCNVTISQSIVGSSACGAGTVIRNFTATNAAGQTNTCTQFITVTADVTNTLTCERINFADLNNNTYDWCDVNDNNNDNDDDLPAIVIDCADGLSVPELDIDIDGLCTEVGLSIAVDTFNFAGGACKKYVIHYEVIDQCVFEENYVDPVTGELDPFNSDNGYFEFFLEVDAFDNEAPEMDCSDIEVVAQSCTGFDGSIIITGTDNCTDPAYFGYQWRLDVGADNTIDTDWIASSTVTPASTGLGISEFPIGTHTIYWLVSDGCGNDATCTQTVTITENDKAPTPYCIDGLATAVMPSTGSVEIWATDFDAGSFDNCDGPLTITMIPEIDADGLSDDAAFTASQAAWIFDCSYIENGVSAILEVRIYVEDADGNYDYCTASLRIDDNFDACTDTGLVKYEVDGELKTQDGEGVHNVDVTVDTGFPEFPVTENVDVYYSFDLVENVDYIITPEKNDDHLNGLTTADIILIQKHILGLQPIVSPYTLIAADVNNDCKVNGIDVIQIRKLLLGKYVNDEFPDNTSWRFIESDFVFPIPEAPCEFNEATDIFNLSADETNDFIATKIGDINGSADANFTNGGTTRSDETLEFLIDDRDVQKGNTYSIPFLASDFTEIQGFQYTLNLTGAEFVTVESGAIELSENNFGLRNEGFNVSVDIANGTSIANDEVLFTIVIEATKDAKLSEIITINSSGLTAEAYAGNSLEILGSDVVFRTKGGIVKDAVFELYQNEPNPFNELTTIGFELPSSGNVTISIYDVTGKVIYKKQDVYSKGHNTLSLNRNDIDASGVLYYKLESGDNVATMKMIVID